MINQYFYFFGKGERKKHKDAGRIYHSTLLGHLGVFKYLF